MRLPALPHATLGYCTNVHPGRTLDQIKRQLVTHAVPVHSSLPIGPEQPFGETLGVGLWFSAEVAEELMRQGPDAVAAFRDWLHGHGLHCFTLNGFPFGDFHQPVVKHAVYQPTWADPRRYAYTRQLATILAGLLPDDADTGSISTLPLGWGPNLSPADHGAAAAQLTDLVHDLARLELVTGKRIRVAIEPEPGCALQSAHGLVDFFENHLLGTLDEVSVRGYLGVCHDVCHSAVMFEPQREALDTYAKAGIDVVKAQLSNAIETRFEPGEPENATKTLDALEAFVDAKFLHQTTVRHERGQDQWFEDLPEALAHLGQTSDALTARTHFHVPLFHDTLSPLCTTQAQLRAFLASDALSRIPHLEVETYAWGVLPEPYRRDDLASGIAKELRWVADTIEATR